MPATIRRLVLLAIVLAAGAIGASPARAQSQSGFDTTKQWKIEKLGENHWRFTGAVEVQHGTMKFYANELESWTDTHRAVLTGDVTFVDGQNQISADRVDFNTETKQGTFFNAHGSAIVSQQPKQDMLGGQDGAVLFYGEQIEKIGPKKYKIHNGGFTTCLQPTPRWNVTSGTVILNLDHYAFLTNAILKAKSIPVFYLPVLYYPINKEDRSTGILMPVYGTSTYRGFTLSNAFFWAINRSQDATFLHDWFSKRGQGMGAEYRYVLARGQGSMRFYRLNERATTDSSTGASYPASKSYEVRGSGNYRLAGGWNARGRVDYFTSLQTQQLYHTNIYDASRSQRAYSGGLSGQLLGLGLNASYDRSEYFTGKDDAGNQNSSTTGGTPRISLSRGERPLFGSVVYFSATGEYANLVREYKRGGSVTDYGLSRVEFAPVLRVPFTKLPWMTVNSSVTWRDTHWTRRYDPAQDNAVVDRGISRRYFDLQSRITGPVVNRVWNTPGSGYAEKWKHIVEPYVNMQKITSVENVAEIVKLEGNDYAVGTTKVDYGVTNRLLVKPPGGGSGASPRDILSVRIAQTYYTNAEASKYDYNYATSFSGRAPSKFSAIGLSLTASPADRLNGTLRAEYDPNKGGLLSLSTSGQYAVHDWLDVQAGFSRRKLPQRSTELGRSNDNFINATASLRSRNNRVGGHYTFNYDIGNSTLLNSRIIAYYNAQCCGFSVEYQTYNYPSSWGRAIPADNRFNFSFTLAGLGTFSNFFGAFGGTSR